MAGGAVQKWEIGQAWDMAVTVTAAAYGIAPEILRAESRGRGPRPPKDAWLPKKMAVHLTVVLSGSDYAELARLTGLHRDTVASHCASIRDLCATDLDADTQAEGLLAFAVNRLLNPGAPLPQPATPSEERLSLAWLNARMEVLEALVRDLIRRDGDHPTAAQDHGKLILLPGTRRARA